MQFRSLSCCQCCVAPPAALQPGCCLQWPLRPDINPDGFRNLFDGYYDENVYFNMPNHYLCNLHDGNLLDAIRRLDIKIVIGEHDPFRSDNQRLSELMWSKGIWHTFRVWSGRAHGYRRWREMVGWFV